MRFLVASSFFVSHLFCLLPRGFFFFLLCLRRFLPLVFLFSSALLDPFPIIFFFFHSFILFSPPFFFSSSSSSFLLLFLLLLILFLLLLLSLRGAGGACGRGARRCRRSAGQARGRMWPVAGPLRRRPARACVGRPRSFPPSTGCQPKTDQQRKESGIK